METNHTDTAAVAAKLSSAFLNVDLYFWIRYLDDGLLNDDLRTAIEHAELRGARIRCIVAVKSMGQGESISIPASWELKVIAQAKDINPYLAMDINSIFIDHKFLFIRNALTNDLWCASDTRSDHEIEGPRFEAAWTSRAATKLYDLLPLTHLTDPGDSLRNIVFASEKEWSRIINLLSLHPEDLYEMDPRKFEELTAELLSRQGLEVNITPTTRDGGRDILAFADTLAGRHLYVVECKRFHKDRPVGVSLVRGVYGVVDLERATAGMIVTTSRFTEPAKSLVSTSPHRMSLKDYGCVVEWINKYK